MVGNGVDDNSFLGVVSLSENVSQEVQTQSSSDSFEVRYESYINNNDGTVDLKLTVDDMTESYRLEGIWCVSVEDVYVADINIADSFSNIIVTVGGEDEDCKTYIYAFDKHQIGQVIDYRGRIVPDSINGNGTVSLSYIIGMGIQDYGQFTVRPELMVYSLGARVYVDLFSGRTIYSESGSTYEDGFDVTITSDLSVYSNALYEMSSSGVIPAGSTVNCEYTSKGEYDYALYVSCGDVQGYVSNQMLKECCEGMYFAG